MSAVRYRLPRAVPARTAVLRSGALMAGAALVAGAVLALAPGGAARAAAAPWASASGTARSQQAMMILLDTNAEDASAASRIHAESRAALR